MNYQRRYSSLGKYKREANIDILQELVKSKWYEDKSKSSSKTFYKNPPNTLKQSKYKLGAKTLMGFKNEVSFEEVKGDIQKVNQNKN